MHEYFYSGPVKEFDKVIVNHWDATTYAVSEKKARSNFTFQFKKEYGRSVNARISLPGKITMID